MAKFIYNKQSPRHMGRGNVTDMPNGLVMNLNGKQINSKFFLNLRMGRPDC